MAAHRYWRAAGLAAYNSGRVIELSEFQLLLSGARVDPAATLACSEVPAVGTLATLSDGSAVAAVRLSTSAVLTWDFGAAGQDVDDIRLGGVAPATFPVALSLQWSDDAVTWTTPAFAPYVGVVYPGARVLTGSESPRSYRIFVTKRPETYGLTAIAEIELRGVVGGPDLTTPQISAFASSWDYWDPNGYVPRKAFDNVVDSMNNHEWHSYDAALPQFVGAAFSAPTAVAEFAIAASSLANNYYYYPQDFTLQASWDMAGWVDLRTVTGVTSWGVGEFKAYSVPMPTRIRTTTIAGSVGDAMFSASQGAVPAFSAGVEAKRIGSRANFLFDSTARGRIDGTVKRKSDPSNVALRRRVRLYRDIDGLLIAETWSSAATGAYSFDYIEPNWTYTVIAFDHEHNFRAVLADNLTPSLIP